MWIRSSASPVIASGCGSSASSANPSDVVAGTIRRRRPLRTISSASPVSSTWSSSLYRLLLSWVALTSITATNAYVFCVRITLYSHHPDGKSGYGCWCRGMRRRIYHARPQSPARQTRRPSKACAERNKEGRDDRSRPFSISIAVVGLAQKSSLSPTLRASNSLPDLSR